MWQPGAATGYGVNLFAATVETPIYGDDVWSEVIKEFDANEDSAHDETARDREFMVRAVERIKFDPARYLRARLRQYPRLF